MILLFKTNMILHFILIYSNQLDLLLNKPILLRSIPYDNYIIAEDVSDFSLNVFHTVNLNHGLTNYNKLSMLEKEGNKYKLKIGNYFVCHDKEVACNYDPTDKKCINNEYRKFDCDVCKNKIIKACENDPELWEIERTALGYNIKQHNQCLTLGFKIFLDECKGSKDQLFGFENYELMNCLENYNFRKVPKTKKELIDAIKMNKLLKATVKDNPKKFNKLTKKDKTADEALKELMPDIDKKPKMKKLWGSLWNFGMNGYSMPSGFSLKMLCGKWW